MRVCFNVLLLLSAVRLAWAAEPQAIDDSPEVLRFIENAERVYVFPVTSPLNPERDDAHMRLLGPEARHVIVELLGRYENWYHGLYTFLISEPQPTNVGLIFRREKDELVLFFNSDTVHGRFAGIDLDGVLEDKPKKQFERWKRHYAQRELAFK
jgi:hypothetical protein